MMETLVALMRAELFQNTLFSVVMYSTSLRVASKWQKWNGCWGSTGERQWWADIPEAASLCLRFAHIKVSKTGARRWAWARRRPLATPFCLCGLRGTRRQIRWLRLKVPLKWKAKTRARAHNVGGSLCFVLILLSLKKKDCILSANLHLPACCPCSKSVWEMVGYATGSGPLVIGLWVDYCWANVFSFLLSCSDCFFNQLHNQNIRI